MLTTLISIFVVASLLLGGGGASVYAAQDSLPGESLYAVKTLGEDVRLDLAGSAQAQLALELAYANRRVDEMRQLAGRGEPVPEAVGARYQQQMGTAFQITAGLADADLLPALERVRQALRTQERALQDLPGGAGAQAVLNRVRLHLQLVEDGLQDPQAYRRQLRQGLPLNGPGDPGQGPGACEDCPKAGETPGAGNSYGPGPAASQEPAGGAGNSFGPGPQASGTSVPGSGYGPGPSASQEPKEGARNSYGPGPSSTEAPRSDPQDGSGQQNGSGNGSDSSDCIPNGGGTGAQATQAPGSGGSGDGTCDGCGTGPNGPQPPASDPGSGAGGGQDSGQGSGSGSPAGGGGGRP